ncbi:DUF92 domain-containing protein [soil metagenome]
MIERLFIGLAVSLLVSVAGWKAHALSGSGAMAAVVVGTAIAAGASWPGIVVLGTFFVLSSALSRIRSRDDVSEKGSRRDAGQVLANGGVAALAALPGVVGHELLAFALVAASLAAATADTWATEIGSTSTTPPRMLVSRRQARRGEAGGVTTRGTLAALAGATLVGTVAAVAGGIRFGTTEGFVIGTVAAFGGIVGAMADSLAGELIQERRYCPVCRQATEATTHRCGTATVQRVGVTGLNNDVVNVLCTLSGALVGGLILVF